MATELTKPEALSPLGQQTLRRLLRVRFEFERRLARVPILTRLDKGTFTIADYRALLLNLRPQVVEGARWISRSASSFDRDHTDVRAAVIEHAGDEHRDYELIDSDYAAVGGKPGEIRSRSRNLGTEILHGYLMHRATRPNPCDLLGAMWIIEGLGEKMANNWAARIEELTGCEAGATRFLRYHATNDEAHMNKLFGLLDRVCTSRATADAIVLTARIVARLYALQLEEIDHEN